MLEVKTQLQKKKPSCYFSLFFPILFFPLFFFELLHFFFNSLSLMQTPFFFTPPSTLCPLMPFSEMANNNGGYMYAGMRVNTDKTHIRTHTSTQRAVLPESGVRELKWERAVAPRQSLDMNTLRGSAWHFLGAGVRRMKASGCRGLQFRVTNLTNCPFIATQEQPPTPKGD